MAHLEAGARVLVTGGAGFIGANVVRSLLNQRYSVRVLDNFSSGRREYLRGLDIEVIEGDIRSKATIQKALEDCHAVVHLAAMTGVLDSIAHPDTCFEINVAGTFQLLQACVAGNVKHFVFASSNAALGEHDPPVDEMTIPRPLSPYGASKLAGEAYCLSFSHSYGIRTTVLRFANAYGPWSWHSENVVSRFIRRILRGDPIPVYGDGNQTRDFIFATDVAEAIVLALRYTGHSDIFQIATGKETSILELANVLGEVAGISPKIEWHPQPIGEIRRNYASIDRARDILGFTPRISLRDGLAMTLEWFRQWEMKLAYFDGFDF